jgi:hypothetical protein
MLHRYSYEFQRCFTIPAFYDVACQRLTLVINGPPKIKYNSVNLHKNLTQMQMPVRASAHQARLIATELRSKHRAKSVQAEPNRFLADIYPTLLQEILQVPQ